MHGLDLIEIVFLSLLYSLLATQFSTFYSRAYNMWV